MFICPEIRKVIATETTQKAARTKRQSAANDDQEENLYVPRKNCLSSSIYVEEKNLKNFGEICAEWVVESIHSSDVEQK